LNDVPIGLLVFFLVLLIILSAFFSGSETALMMLNRYRLLHRVKSGHTGAIRAQSLLQHTDRLIGFILLGNNFVNILASSLSTVIALRLFGEKGIAAAAGLLTLVILIFAEVTPKTLAAMNPDRLAYPAAQIIAPLLRMFYPVVWTVNGAANLLLHLMRIRTKHSATATLSKDELRTLVAEASALIPDRYHNMLLSILDLESATIEDIMVPRNEIVGIDLDDPFEEVVTQIRNSRYTRLPVYRKSIDKVFGFVHLRKVLIEMSRDDFAKETFSKMIDKIHFFPKNVALHQLLQTFKRENIRFGLVVDEYGDVTGLVTLEDLLQEIVGEFTTSPVEIRRQKDGSYLVDAGMSLRELNRLTGWALPTEGPKTLNGLIIEYLETIPEPGTSLKLFDFYLEITSIENNVIKQVRFFPEMH
jgi:Mg2+/Co2+ transporter CorB